MKRKRQKVTNTKSKTLKDTNLKDRIPKYTPIKVCKKKIVLR